MSISRALPGHPACTRGVICLCYLRYDLLSSQTEADRIDAGIENSGTGLCQCAETAA